MRTIRITAFILLTALIIGLFVNAITAIVYGMIAICMQWIIEPKDD